MNRKILSAVIMTSLIVSAFAGCGSTDSSDSTETSAAETSAAETEAASESEESEAETSETESDSEAEAETEASSDDFGVWTALAGDNGTTYPNLFKVILSDEDYSYWYDYSAAVVGEDNAKSTVDYLRSFISADIYGDEAVAAYADADSFLFDCWYLNDVDTFTFKDDTATITKTDGSSETHTYEYLGVYQIGEGETMKYQGQEFCPAFDVDVYKSTDDAGDFTYFLFRDDTMETTYHTEFRYGDDLDELQKYLEGKYAYWLSAGISQDPDKATLENVISLFCLENMDYSAERTEADLAQISDFVGTWDADLSGYGDDYADTELYTVIGENGHGETYMNSEKSADYNAYAYDNDEKGDGKGIYVAYSNLTGEVSHAEYTIEEEDGKTVLTFVNDEGAISYVKRAE